MYIRFFKEVTLCPILSILPYIFYIAYSMSMFNKVLLGKTSGQKRKELNYTYTTCTSISLSCIAKRIINI